MITYLAATTVHATGVNWVGISPIIIAVITSIGLAVGFILKRLDRNRDRTEKFVTGQVSGVTEAVAGRLDRIDIHLMEQDKTVSLQNERLARVEGQLLSLYNPKSV